MTRGRGGSGAEVSEFPLSDPYPIVTPQNASSTVIDNSKLIQI